MPNPILDEKPVRLGDFLCYSRGDAQALDELAKDGVMVKGWSPNGEFVLLSWVGAVRIDECTWADPGKVLPVHRKYRTPTKNLWDEAVQSSQGPVPKERPLVCQEKTLINEAGRVVVADLCEPVSLLLKANQENDWRLPELVRKYVTPGIDANLCKCDRCEGIYWVDEREREKRKERKPSSGRKAGLSRRAA